MKKAKAIENISNTIIFGNGINRLTKANKSWTDLLDQIKGENKFTSESLPYTMIYERIILGESKGQSNLTKSELEVKTKISELMATVAKHDIYYNL